MNKKNDIYLSLNNKIDNFNIRAPYHEKLYLLFKELYTEEEAFLITKMPYQFSTIDKISKITKFDNIKTKKTIDKLCKKGLVFDVFHNNEFKYIMNPFIPGIFEFPLMRVNNELDILKISKYLTGYFNYDEFWKINFDKDKIISVIRTIPHLEAVEKTEYSEIINYQNINNIIDEHDKFAVSMCACRRKQKIINKNTCNIPLNICTSFGNAADYLIRHGLAEEISKTEMLENIDRSKEMGLVFGADNVKNKISFLCHCCKCCCAPLTAIRKFGYDNIIITSSYIAKVNNKCLNCRKCINICPVDAIYIEKHENKELIKINEKICLGCGVCNLKCNNKGIELIKRKNEIITPENTFERIILQSLERNTLQNLLFENDNLFSHRLLRYFIGGFLKIPVIKKNIMIKMLKSNFLDNISKNYIKV